ncbi:dihydrofolate reductase [Blastochloris tepida]|uniref:Dihydrofolate reductase n=1 Tax=Blastochloris tepida TaxID=2233851 RepID=A0A348FVP2_9HYPH|nr:dihydrofolate reductase [Blastochloris tepida]BBF91375.1 dihydrofolate reductase [Blastochloris tepida]
MAAAIVIVAAVAENGVIGRNAALPWRLPSDLKHFKATTLGRPLVMGRKTYASIGRPLPGRLSIVVTRDRGFAAPGVLAAASLTAALRAAEGEALRRGTGEIMVVGGGELYAEALPLADRLVLTEVAARPEGDVHFPPFDRSRWRETARVGPVQGEADEAAMSFVTYCRAG